MRGERPKADQQEVYLLIYVSPNLQVAEEIYPDPSTAYPRQPGQAGTTTRLVLQ